MSRLPRALPLALGLSVVGSVGAVASAEAPVPEGYEAPRTTVTVSTVWEAPRSTVSLFYTDPPEAGTEALEEALGVTTEADDQVVQISDRFLFDFDSAELRPTAASSLDTVQALLEQSDAPVEVIGHTDGLGTDEVNQPLSEDRAEAVADYLVEHGIDEGRLTSSGKGSSEPVAENTHPDGRDNPEGRQQTRRVEIRFSDDG